MRSDYRRRHRLPPVLLDRARQMRREQAPAEARLWSMLRNRQCGGYKSRRQFVLGPYIADIVCEEARLVVELDGLTHEFTDEYDACRTEWLEVHGYRVLRLTNGEVRQNLEGVVETILLACRERTGDP